MKNYRIIPVLLLSLVIMASGCHRNHRKDFAERGARMGMMHKFRPGGGFRGMMPGWRMAEGRGGMMMHGMRRGMYGMMPGGMAGMDSTGIMPFGLGRRMMQSIPNVTDSQKKQIEDLIKKHQDEIKQLHEEMAAKMKTIMTSQRTDILNVMTDEQKKYLENTEKTK